MDITAEYSKYLINFAVDIVCILFDIVILIELFAFRKQKEKRERFFIGCICTNMVCLLGNMFSCFFCGYICVPSDPFYSSIGQKLQFVVNDNTARFLTSSGMFISILFSYIFIFFAVFYLLDYVIEKNNKIIRIYKIIETSILIISVLLLAINPFTRIYYFYDTNNIYAKGPLYLLSQILGILMVAIGFMVIIKYKKSMSKRIFLSYLSLIIIPCIVEIIKLYHVIFVSRYDYTFNFVYCSATFALLIFAMNVLNFDILASRTDNLSGLESISAYYARLNNEYKYLKSCGVIFIDLNGLKSTNDKYGHFSGDDLIVKLGDSIRPFTCDMIHAYRYGGDEFIIILTNCEKGEIYDLLDNWLDSLYKINQSLENKVDVSYGFAYSKDNVVIENLVNLADQDMYVHKRRKKNNYGTEKISK